MKKLIGIIIVLFITMTAQAYNQYNDVSNTFSSSNSTIKVYDKYGSLQGYQKKQSNGKVKTYNKYSQYTGYYKKSGNKVIYYPEGKGK